MFSHRPIYLSALAISTCVCQIICKEKYMPNEIGQIGALNSFKKLP
jgi:hypothetical protein